MNKRLKPPITFRDATLGLRKVWEFRDLLSQLVVRDLKVKYQRSPLGFLWSFLNPLVTSLIIIAVFTYIIRIPVAHFWAFLLSGYFVWNFIQQGLNDATHILKDHSALRRSVAFPAEILIWSASVSKMLEFLVEIAMVIAILLLFHHQSIPSSLILFPVIILIQWVMTVGLMYPLSTASVLYYDVQHALPIVLISLFYISPVFYPVEMIPEALRPFYFLNPFAGMFTLYHAVLYDGQWPSGYLLSGVAASALAILTIGYAIFNRYKNISVEIA